MTSSVSSVTSAQRCKARGSGCQFFLMTSRGEFEPGNVVERGDQVALSTMSVNLSPETLLSAAINMSTAALLGGAGVRRSMVVDLQIPAWLFVLLNRNDPRLRFYASLTLCVLAAEGDLERQVDGAVNLRQAVDSFLKTYRPDYVAKLDTKF
uniref:Uncharacterized protein n=1 Tax=Romanomermis culicivorax TaxID=13658 RepID=A0A915JNE5_ROMCU